MTIAYHEMMIQKSIRLAEWLCFQPLRKMF